MIIKQLKSFIEDEMGKLDYDIDNSWGRLDVDEVEKLKLDEDEVFFRGFYTAWLMMKEFLGRYDELTPIQTEMLDKKCPACGEGDLHPVGQGDDSNETCLWCNNCDCSVDGDGGFIS